jgi:class 3 adenylate cyclase
VQVCPQCGEENGPRARFCSNCGFALAQVAAGEAGERKLVTILFTDVTGSTSLGEQLDPESLRGVMTRYYDVGRSAVEAHGGTVEKFIGDAVMAVFGVPQVHEDDALRGVRAALELRDKVETLNDELESRFGVRLSLRTGVTTGEVFVGSGEVFATGDAVNVAARLEQAASPGEVLIGEPTEQLVRHLVDLEPLEPLDLKGKAEPVAAWRVLGLVSDAAAGAGRSGPLVGRELELAVLREAHEAAVVDRRCQLVILAGPAGIGKSRLVRELVTSEADGSRVFSGQCLPYGEGITFWPLAQVVRAAAGIDAAMAADDVRRCISSTLGPDADAEVIAERIAGAIGLAGGNAPPEEIFWAVRRFIASLAGDSPAVVVFDDVHWAEPTLFDLVDHLASSIRDASVLLLCCARPELFDVRPEWSEHPDARTIVLAPFSEEETRRLIDALGAGVPLEPELRERVSAAAGGNPLFVAEMLAMLVERGATGNGVPMPPTIQALLTARLDQLEPREHTFLARASVVGEEFSLDAARALGDDGDLVSVVDALVRKELITTSPGGDSMRFSHLLLRDAAYAAVPKAVRADLHERYARFLEQTSGDRVSELEAIIGYHLEQAYRHRLELGPEDEGARTIAGHAASRLHAAGAHASARGDVRAASSLLARARDLVPADAPERAEIGADLGAALLDLGQLEAAGAELAAAESLAGSTGQRVVQLAAQLALGQARAQSDPHFDVATAFEVISAAIPELERHGADRVLAQAWRLLGFFHLIGHQFGPLEEAATRSLQHARRAGGAGGQADALFWLTLGVALGPRPAASAVNRCEELLAEASGPHATAAVMHALAALRAMTGEIDEGRRLMRQVRETFRDLGLAVQAEGAAHTEAMVALHGGDLDGAEQTLRPAIEALAQGGETAFLSLLLGLLAGIRARRGDVDEALELAERCRAVAVLRMSQAYASVAKAHALAQRGESEEAAALAREALLPLVDADDSHTRGWMAHHAAEALALAGELDAARSTHAEAEALFSEKGCVVCTAQVRERVARLPVQSRVE